jgi:hypothetical protein
MGNWKHRYIVNITDNVTGEVYRFHFDNYEAQIEHGITRSKERGHGEKFQEVSMNGMRRATFKMWAGCYSFNDFQTDAKSGRII